MKDSYAKSVLAAIEAEVYRIKKTYNKLDLIITPSDYHKARLEESKVTNTKIVRLRNFLPGNIRFVDEVKAGSYMLYFGRISQEKGIITLIKAYAASNITTELYVVGRGPLDQEVKDLVHELKIEDKVRILGFKSGEELQNIVRGAKCVFLPSECSENSPISLLEAMAAGRPIVVSRNGGLPELIQDDKNGYIVTPRSVEDFAAVFRKMDQFGEDKLIAMGKNSQDIVKELADIDNYVKTISGYYQELLTERK